MADRAEIKTKVIHNLAIVSGFDESQFEEGKDLETDYGLSGDLLGALAPGFTKIAASYHPGAVVKKADCAKLKTVKDAIDLVLARAN